MRAWFYRPAFGYAHSRRGLDAGRQSGLVHRTRLRRRHCRSPRGFATELPKGIDEAAVEGIERHALRGSRTCAWSTRGRSPAFRPGTGARSAIRRTSISSRRFIDEVAAAAGKDPVEFRRSLLAGQPRLRGVLDLAAQKAGWGSPQPPGVHRGVALTNCFGSFVAQVAEVSMDARGRPRVHRIVAAVDCGRTVNPDVIHRQVEGAIVYGLSAALHGKITFRNGRVEQSNFNDYPMLRMDEMPKVEVHIVPSTEAPAASVNRVCRLQRLPWSTRSSRRPASAVRTLPI